MDKCPYGKMNASHMTRNDRNIVCVSMNLQNAILS